MTDTENGSQATISDTASGNASAGFENQATDVPVSATESSNNAVSDASVASTAKPAEKMVAQSEVNRLVGQTREHVRQEAYQRALREFEAKSQQQQANGQQQNQSQQQSSTSMGGVNQPSSNDIDRMINERLEKLRVESIAQQIESDFNSKMKAGENKYPDFHDAMADLELAKMPNIVLWANSLDNTADVMYEFSKNPTKLTSVMMLANAGFPQLAQKELQKLSDSIKTNEAASKQAVANQPLDQMSHSPTGTDGGNLAVRDYRKMDWLRA